MASLQARITALAQAIGADIKALVNVYMPRAAFGGTVDKTRKMANAQVGAIDAFLSVDGPGTDWPAQSLSTAWWNVFTFGTPARMSQIAQQAFHTRQNQIWVRHFHDLSWSQWARLPATFAETGFLIQDGGLLGYGAGCGGTVTQPTNKATPVTLNKACGRIQMSDSAMNPGESVVFRFNNSLITPVTPIAVAGAWEYYAPESYRIEVAGVGGGTCLIRVTNITSGVLSQAQAIVFVIHAGTTT